MTRTRTRLAVLAAAATALVPLAGGTASAAPTPDRPGAVRGGDTWLLRAALSGGAPTTRFAYGRPTDYVHVTGDWDGNGTRTPGIVRSVAGIWTWYLRNSNSAGPADLVFRYGTTSSPVGYDVPVVGDWDGDGRDSVGAARIPAAGGPAFWQLRNSAGGGPAEVRFAYGPSDGPPVDFVTGDWDGNGTDTPGVASGSDSGLEWALRNSTTTGDADVRFSYGAASDQPVVGDWDGDGRDGIGTVRRISGQLRWQLRQVPGAGPAQVSFAYGSQYDTPVVWA